MVQVFLGSLLMLVGLLVIVMVGFYLAEHNRYLLMKIKPAICILTIVMIIKVCENLDKIIFSTWLELTLKKLSQGINDVVALSIMVAVVCSLCFVLSQAKIVVRYFTRSGHIV